MRIGALLLVLCSAIPASLPAQIPDLAAPAVRSGDIGAQLEDAWTTLLQDPESFAAQWTLMRWDRMARLAPSPLRSADDWGALRARVEDNGWSHRLLGWLQLDALRREQRHEEARSLGMVAGAPRRWWGIGPFGTSPSVALHRGYPPEISFDPDASYTTPAGPVSWRTVTLPESDTRIFPQEEWGRRGAVYYLRSRIRVPSDVEALLQVATPGSCRVWIDGREIVTIDRAREAEPLFRQEGVFLGAGDHTLLVKNNGASISVLLRDSRGFPLALEDLDPQEPTENAPSEPRPELKPQGFILHALEEEWQRGSLDPAWRLPLAVLLSEQGRPYLARELLLEAEQAEEDGVALALAVAAASPQLAYLPESWRKSWREGHRRRALEHDPEVIPLRLDRARELLADDRILEAAKELDEILARQPQALEALLGWEQLTGERGWRREHADVIERLAERGGDNPSVLRVLVQYHEGRGTPRQALAPARRLHRQSPSETSARILSRLLLRQGEVEEGWRVWDELETTLGRSTGLLRSRLRYARESGKTEEEEAILRQLARRVPDDATTPEDLAQLLWRDGRKKEAAAAYQESLRRGPGRVETIRQRQRLRSTADRADFWTPHVVSLDQALESAPPSGHYPKAEAVFLVDQMVTRVLPDGGGEEMVHQIIRIESLQGVKEFSELPVSGELYDLRVITPDGEELHPTASGSSRGYTLPGLEPGAVIEVRSVRRFDLRRPEDLVLGTFYFQDPQFTHAFHRSEWIVLLPPGWEPEIDARNFAGEHTVTERNGSRELLWRTREMPRVEPEVRSPPAAQIVPNVTLRGSRDWEPALERVAGWGAQDDLVTPELRRAAAEILGDAPDATRREKVERLYAAVCDRVPAEGQSSNATEVWLDRRGNRDLLLAGLLRAAGIPFDRVFVALQDDRTPFLDWTLPSTDYFRLLLLRVPLETGEPFYVSARYRAAPPGRIPLDFQEARAFLTRAEGGEWTTTPSVPPDDLAQTLDLEVDVAPGAERLAVVGRVEYRQLLGYQLKEQLKGLNDFTRKTALERFVQQTFPGARIEEASFGDLQDRSVPFRLRFQVGAPGLLQDTGSALALRPVHAPSNLVRQFIRKSERVFPYVVGSETIIREHASYRLAEGARVQSLPESLELQGDWGSYQLSYRQQGEEILLRKRLHIRPCVISPEDFPRFVAFCRQVDGKEQERILLRGP